METLVVRFAPAEHITARRVVTGFSSPRNVMANRDSSSAVADRALVERMVRRDEGALGKLYDRYGATAYSVAYAIVGERADAEEVVVDTFSQLWRSAEQFDPARGNVAAWLSAVARSRALDLVRARGRRSRALDRAAREHDSEFASPLSLGRTPDRLAELAEGRRLVAEALAQLPEPQRRVIEMAYWGGLSQSEIAAELSEPLGTVKTRVRAGMKKLQDVLGPRLAGAWS